ncbi:hypothetical protein FGB62_34g114 [Gracilaria domingensis]|nr:hypothetical protein FGB62_34g114 [Gracilaria domingensis]
MGFVSFFVLRTAVPAQYVMNWIEAKWFGGRLKLKGKVPSADIILAESLKGPATVLYGPKEAQTMGAQRGVAQ